MKMGINMLNYIWAGMLAIGLCFGVITGRGEILVTAIISGSKEAVTLAINICGIIAFWCGIMKIAEESGMIDSLSKKISPILDFLFPSVPKNHIARGHIATNLAANFLGLGWAATPAGLLAMEELQRLNKDKRTASDAMCMFLIVNMSSVQLISVNIIALRAQYQSQSPSDIIVPSIIATTISTAVGIIFAKMYERHRVRWKR